MKQYIKCKNRTYNIDEAIAYYILGFKEYSSEVEKIKKKDWIIIIKFILELSNDEVKMEKTIEEHKELLKKIQFAWKLSTNDFTAYATCIFYVLTNREKVITPEKIVNEFLSRIYLHHPRRVMQEAEFLWSQYVPENDEKDKKTIY